jgi:hypothetical protein
VVNAARRVRSAINRREPRINSPRRRALQRAEDDAMRTTIGLSRRQIGATRRAGTFLDISRAFVSSGLPGASSGRRLEMLLVSSFVIRNFDY